MEEKKSEERESISISSNNELPPPSEAPSTYNRIEESESEYNRRNESGSINTSMTHIIPPSFLSSQTTTPSPFEIITKCNALMSRLSHIFDSKRPQVGINYSSPDALDFGQGGRELYQAHNTLEFARALDKQYNGVSNKELDLENDPDCHPTISSLTEKLTLAVNQPRVCHTKRHYSGAEKMAMLEESQILGGVYVCNKYEVDRTSLSQWEKIVAQAGPMGLIKRAQEREDKYLTIKEELFKWFKQQRDKRDIVTVRLLQQQAQRIAKEKPELGLVDAKFCRQWVTAFCREWRMSRKRKTNAVSRTRTEQGEIVYQFLKKVKELREKVKYDIFVNLDETPFYFDMSSNYTMDFTGSRETLIRTHKLAKTKITLVLAITSEGEFLKPQIVFPCTSRFPKDASHLRAKMLNTVDIKWNKTGWNTGQMMISWVTSVLAPVAESGKKVLFVIDHSSQHVNRDMEVCLREHKIDCVIIPKGMTPFLQPLDVVINKPMKDYVRQHYDDWLSKKEEGGFDPPSKELVVQWIIAAIKLNPPQRLINSFIKCGITVDYTMNGLEQLYSRMKNLGCGEERLLLPLSKIEESPSRFTKKEDVYNIITIQNSCPMNDKYKFLFASPTEGGLPTSVLREVREEGTDEGSTLGSLSSMTGSARWGSTRDGTKTNFDRKCDDLFFELEREQNADALRGGGTDATDIAIRKRVKNE